jgi:hypothetical protein
LLASTAIGLTVTTLSMAPLAWNTYVHTHSWVPTLGNILASCSVWLSSVGGTGGDRGVNNTTPILKHFLPRFAQPTEDLKHSKVEPGLVLDWLRRTAACATPAATRSLSRLGLVTPSMPARHGCSLSVGLPSMFNTTLCNPYSRSHTLLSCVRSRYRYHRSVL